MRCSTQISNFWFAKTAHIIPNHLTGDDVASVLPAGVDPALYAGRAVVTKRLKPVPVEAIARGYIIGSGWKDYQATGALCGITLPPDLKQAQKLPEPIFTPSTKAAVGDHDENVSFDTVVASVGEDLANAVRKATLEIYAFAAAYAAQRGIIVADTKLEDQRQHVSQAVQPKQRFGVGPAGPAYRLRAFIEPADPHVEMDGHITCASPVVIRREELNSPNDVVVRSDSRTDLLLRSCLRARRVLRPAAQTRALDFADGSCCVNPETELKLLADGFAQRERAVLLGRRKADLHQRHRG